MSVVDGEKPRSGATSAGARWRAPSTADGFRDVYNRAEPGPPPEKGCLGCLGSLVRNLTPPLGYPNNDVARAWGLDCFRLFRLGQWMYMCGFPRAPAGPLSGPPGPSTRM